MLRLQEEGYFLSSNKLFPRPFHEHGAAGAALHSHSDISGYAFVIDPEKSGEVAERPKAAVC